MTSLAFPNPVVSEKLNFISILNKRLRGIPAQKVALVFGWHGAPPKMLDLARGGGGG